jgi:hypothetical protein
MFDFLETNEEDLRQGANGAYAHLEVNWERLGVPDPAEALKTPKEDYDAALTAAQDPDHTKSQVMDKKRTKKAVKSAYRAYANEYLIHNHRLTSDDIVMLRLHTKKHRSTKQPPDTIPIVVVILHAMRQITFKFYGDHSPGKRRRAGKPRNVDAFVLYWAILDHEPTHLAELINRSSCTSSPLVLTFSEEDRGKRLYFVACWQINRDRLEGPTTDIRMVIVP